jgi:ribosomal protein L27
MMAEKVKGQLMENRDSISKKLDSKMKGGEV